MLWDSTKGRIAENREAENRDSQNLVLRLFGGLSLVEIAELRGVTARMLNRYLEFVRNTLLLVLGDSA